MEIQSAPCAYLSLEQLKILTEHPDEIEPDLLQETFKLMVLAKVKTNPAILEWSLQKMTRDTFIEVFKNKSVTYAHLDSKNLVIEALRLISQNDPAKKSDIFGLYGPLTAQQLSLLSADDYQKLNLTSDQLRYLFAWTGKHTGVPGIDKNINLERFMSLEKEVIEWLLQNMDKSTIGNLFYQISWSDESNTKKAIAHLKTLGIEVPQKG